MTSELATDYSKANEEEKGILELLIAPLQLAIKTTAIRRITREDKENDKLI